MVGAGPFKIFNRRPLILGDLSPSFSRLIPRMGRGDSNGLSRRHENRRLDLDQGTGLGAVSSTHCPALLLGHKPCDGSDVPRHYQPGAINQALMNPIGPEYLIHLPA